MIFEVKKERRQYAEALIALVELHACDCHETCAPTFAAIRLIADALKTGRLTLLRPAFQRINKRLFGTPNSRAITDRHAVIRKKIRVMRTMAGEHARDPELAELAYVLLTLNKLLGIDPGRTTRLADQKSFATYGHYLHEAVTTELALAASTPAMSDSKTERQRA